MSGQWPTCRACGFGGVGMSVHELFFGFCFSAHLQGAVESRAFRLTHQELV